jgi:hypothetical protein
MVLQMQFKITFAIFWDIALCNLYMNQRFGGTYHLLLQDASSYHAGFLLG